jgi:spermidine/putrescine transport system substrate-binding protein
MKSLLLVLLLAASANAAETLRLFIWSEYIDPKVVADFEKANSCKVVIDLYEDSDAMLAKVQAGGGSTFDVIVGPDSAMKPMIKLNLVAPLDRAVLPNYKNLDPKFLKPPFDPENKFSVPYQWGTMGIYARLEPGKKLEPTWGLIFEPKLQPGPFTLIDVARDSIGAALKYNGRSLNSVKPDELKEARDLVLNAKKRAIGFENTVGGKNKVISKAARAAIVYSGEAARGMTEDTNTVYLIPKEGSEIWLDNMVVLTKAPNKALAHKFINFVLDEKVGARISNFTQFGTPNLAARKNIDSELLKNPAIYPPADVMAKLEFLQDLGPNLRMYDEVWTQIKSR